MSEATGGGHVFLSYASEDRLAAEKIARAIGQQGFSVWWDVDIPAGVHYPKFIEEGLKSAACVVVLWSRHSTKSRWVRNEADWGAEQDRLIPVLIDEVEIPWEFRNFQTLNLAGWSGDASDPSFARLIQGLGHRVARGEGAPDPPRPSDAGTTGTPRERSAPRLRRVPLLAGLLLVIIVAIISALQISDRLARSRALQPQEIALTPLTEDGHTRSSCISPDGKYLVYVPMREDRSSLRLRQIETGSESVLVEEAQQGIRSPIFSPDGVYVYFAMAGPVFSMSSDAEYDLFRVPMLGGSPQRIASGILGRRFACSPDGMRLVYKRTVGDSTRVQIAGVDGSGERTVASEQRGSSTPCCLAWSKAGDRIVTTTRDPVTGYESLVAFPSSGGPAHPVGNRLWQAVLDLHALADGSGLLIVGCPGSDTKTLSINLWFLPSGGAEPHRITSDLTYYYQVSADASGRKLALTYYAARRILRVLDAAGSGGYRDVLTDVLAQGRVAWAEPGRLLINQRVGSRVGIVSVDLRSGAARRIATEVDYVTELDRSRDGERLVYTSFEGGEFSIWLADAAGGSPRRLTGEGDEQCARFSPDGSWIACMYRSAADQPWVLRRRSIATGATHLLSEMEGRTPRVSPDGSLIAAAFFAADRRQREPGLVSSEGGEVRFLEGGGPFQMLDWNRDGTGLTCAGRSGAALGLYDLPLSGGAARLLWEIPAGPEAITDAAWNPAGDSLALCLQMTTYDVMLLQGLGSEMRAPRP